MSGRFEYGEPWRCRMGAAPADFAAATLRTHLWCALVTSDEGSPAVAFGDTPEEAKGRADRIAAMATACAGLPQATLAALPAGALAGLVEAAPAMIEQVGWRGHGPLAATEFYCEFCKAHSVDCDAIPHAHECRVLTWRAALSPFTPTPARDAGAGGAE